MRRIAIMNQKGGVGKTTTAVNLAAGLAALGRSVLLIDMDPQANATLALGIEEKQVGDTVFELLLGEATFADARRRIAERFEFIPSCDSLAAAESELSRSEGRGTHLRRALEAVDGYDYVLIDCPPSLGILNVNVLVYVEEVFVPLQCQFFALAGISLLTRAVDVVRRANPLLHISGVIPCMFDARTGLAREVVEEVERVFPTQAFRTRIRNNVRLAEAPSYGKSIFEYAPDSNGAADYLALAREVLDRETPPSPAAAAAPAHLQAAEPAPAPPPEIIA